MNENHPLPLGFDTLPLTPATLANLQRLGYAQMTPIQAASLPPALAGKDLIAQARTGSGKPAAFALVLLSKLDKLDTRCFDVQALVLCPTRELADQVTQEMRRLARADANIKVLTLCGGATLRPQLQSLEHGAHVVVGTPGRICDHLERGSLRLTALTTLVLDEADRMLDMGFADAIAAVVKQCPKQRQTLLYSATYPDGIDALAAKVLRDPTSVRLSEKPAPTQIRQHFYEVAEDQRLHAVSLLLDHFRPVSTLAFCNTRQQCRDLVEVLRAQGFSAMELHGELDQRDRDQVLVRFANRSISVLVATDIAARGLDIDKLEAVVNVDITPDADTHTHRIGRTGRVDAVGSVYNLVSVDEMGRVGRIEQVLGFESAWHPLAELTPHGGVPLTPPMRTLQIMGGRKEKIRPGDVLGALTKDLGFAGEQIGKIDVNDYSTYVAVDAGIADAALRKLSSGRVKGRGVKLRLLER
ncbi:MAG: ATP-dependent RNA helicase DbpA [Rubrivivax sp.]